MLKSHTIPRDEIPRRRRGNKFYRIKRHVRKRLGGTQQALLLLYTFGLLLSSVGNSIFFKKMTTAMPNNGWFISQVTCLAYVPLFGLVVLWSFYKGEITPRMREFKMYKFGFMGFLDGLLCLMCVIGGAFTSGPTQLVLSQGVIPVTMMTSALILHQRNQISYIATFWSISDNRRCFGSFFFSSPDGSTDIQDLPVFNIIYASAAIPNAINQVYKEVAFRDNDLDVNYMQFWVSVYQVLIGLLMAPLNALPFLGPQQVHLTAMPQMITGGISCLLFGKNTIINDCGDTGQRFCDNCSSAWIPVLCYLLFNVTYNVFTLLIVKHGGAALSFVVATLRLPLTTTCFYSSAIMGDYATKPAVEDFLGLIVLVMGLIAYRYGSIWRALEEAAELAGEGRALEFPLLIEPSWTEDDFGINFLFSSESNLSSTKSIAMASLVVEPEPHILRIHKWRTKPLYLTRIECRENQDEEYTPPHYNDEASGFRDRRTLHDFRDAHMEKLIRRVRRPTSSPSSKNEVCYDPFLSDNKISPRRHYVREESKTSEPCFTDNSSDHSSDLSEGSVNSLMASGSFRPTALTIPASPEVSDQRSISGISEESTRKRSRPLSSTHCCRRRSSEIRSPQRSRQKQNASTAALSLMLRGGLDVSLHSSPLARTSSPTFRRN